MLFAALPLFHVNALVVTLLAPLFNGHHVVWAGPQGYRDPALYTHFWKLVQHYRVTAMSAVPTVYAALAGCRVDADISSLRLAFVGASPLPPAVRDGFESTTGIRLVEGYGLTEATCASALGFPDHSRPGAVGQRLPYLQMKVVRGRCPWAVGGPEPGQVGTLAIKGPTVFPGYVTGRGPDGPLLDDLGKVRDGWLDTGDLARLDRRLRLPRRPGEGPHHPRRPQHRPRRHREHPAGPPRGDRRAGRRPTGHPLRRGTRRLRHPHPRSRHDTPGAA